MNSIPKFLKRATKAPRITTFNQLTEAVAPLNEELMGHEIYQSVTNMDQCKTFMKSHVWAVWDFMSLVKRIQQEVTTVTLPWTPPRDPVAAYFINQIVLGEESDDLGSHDCKTATSHYELYLRAMDDVGADYSAIEDYVQSVAAGKPWLPALREN